MREFFRELHKRRVIKVGVAYLVIGWLVLQLADVIFPAMRLPEWSTSLVLGLLIVGFPVALVLSWLFDIGPSGVTTASVSSQTMPAADGASIAVLPFPDMSAEKDQEYFCDGLTDELLSVLTRIPGLRVASRTSSFSFKGKKTDLKAAAEKMQVAHILEGSVRKSGNRIRVTAQLIEAATDSHLWSETYDRELDDIFAIQDDIAAQILEALKCRLGTEQLPNPTTDDPKAYEYFLRGRGYAVSGGKRDRKLAVEMFRKAVDIDPGFLRAWIHMAEECALIAGFFSKAAIWRETADEAAKKAMEIAPGQAGPYLARGYSHMASEQFGQSAEDFSKAIEIDPKLGRGYHFLGRAYYHQGQITAALESFKKATENDPDDFESPLLSTTVYFMRGAKDDAARVAKIGVERAERILADYPDNPRAYYLGAAGLFILGETDRAIEWTERALEIAPDDAATRYNSACFFLKVDQVDRALDCLENSVVSRSWIMNDPDLEPVRNHPRFKAVLDSLPEN
jgi:adenylate cyclase